MALSECVITVNWLTKENQLLKKKYQVLFKQKHNQKYL